MDPREVMGSLCLEPPVKERLDVALSGGVQSQVGLKDLRGILQPH